MPLGVCAKMNSIEGSEKYDIPSSELKPGESLCLREIQELLQVCLQRPAFLGFCSTSSGQADTAIKPHLIHGDLQRLLSNKGGLASPETKFVGVLRQRFMEKLRRDDNAMVLPDDIEWLIEIKRFYDWTTQGEVISGLVRICP